MNDLNRTPKISNNMLIINISEIKSSGYTGSKYVAAIVHKSVQW